MVLDFSAFSDLKNRVITAFFMTVFGIGVVAFGSYPLLTTCIISFGFIVYELFYSSPSGYNFFKFCMLLISAIGIYALYFFRVMNGVGLCTYLVAAAIGADLGGYFLGKMIGGAKLCPKISPNKTVSGFVGGVLVANFLCLISQKCFEFSIPWYVTQIVILSSVVGDLSESKLKRLLEIKDFGCLFPGHGGMLDRFDSLLFASVVLFMFCKVVSL